MLKESAQLSERIKYIKYKLYFSLYKGTNIFYKKAEKYSSICLKHKVLKLKKLES